MTEKTPRFIYATGPGDVVRTFRHWVKGERDPLEVSETYSGQFFAIVRKLGATCRVLSMNPVKDRAEADGFIVENRPPPNPRSGGASFYLGRLLYEARQVAGAIIWRADAVIVTSPVHWWLFAPLRFLGTRVIPSVHCTFWTGTIPKPKSIAHAVLRRLTGWFWRHGPDATLCISEEIAEQVRLLAGKPRGELVVCTPAFDRSLFESMRPATLQTRPRVLYAGRIDRVKGVWDLLDAAIELQGRFPDRFSWTVCGDGPELAALRSAAAERGMASVFECLGHVDRERLRGLLAASSIVVAPTQAGFNEGLNKSVVEGALAGVPVVTTSVVPAKDLVGAAAIAVAPGDSRVLAEAILRVGTDPGIWGGCHEAALAFRARFFAEDRTWGSRLEKVLRSVCAERRG